MIAVVFVVLVYLIVMGVQDGDWTLILIGGTPIVLGVIGGLLQFYGNKKLEEMQKENPKIREICKDIDRQKRHLGL